MIYCTPQVLCCFLVSWISCPKAQKPMMPVGKNETVKPSTAHQIIAAKRTKTRIGFSTPAQHICSFRSSPGIWSAFSSVQYRCVDAGKWTLWVTLLASESSLVAMNQWWTLTPTHLNMAHQQPLAVNLTQQWCKTMEGPCFCLIVHTMHYACCK